MRIGLKLFAALAALAVLLLVAFALIRGLTGVVKTATVQDSAARDPMFAEPAEMVTRPPERSEGEAPVVSSGDDPSRDWVYETLTPVEQTAAELANEP